MKFLASLFITLFYSGFVIAQEDPSVSSLMRYEEAPVDLSNGIPDISVPFVSLPTRSRDISIDVGLKYHPLNGIGADAQAGDCGLGWNLFAGGVISRTIIDSNDAYTFYSSATNSATTAQSNDIYQFNFMGYFGRFILTKKADGTLGIKVLKQKESKLKLTFAYDSHYEITTFNFFDEKGYKYVFNVINNSRNTNTAYYLSSIVDNNDKELVHFNYEVCYTPALIGQWTSKTYNKLSEIVSNGFGKITLIYQNTSSNCINKKLAELVLSDANNNAIKKMKLLGRIKMQISDMSETKKEIYQFTYDNSNRGNNYDLFGFSTDSPCGLPDNPFGKPSPTKCKAGVLIKMLLPTGGSIVYDYESNTYSNYIKNTTSGIWELDQNPNSYYKNLIGQDGVGQYSKIPLIPENFVVSDYGPGPHPFNFTNNDTTFNFTVTGNSGSNKIVYFKLEGLEYGISNIHFPDSIQTHFPTFTLKRTSGSVYSFPHFGESEYYLDDASGLCLGQKVSLSPGNYSVTISSIGEQYNFGTLQMKTIDLNTTNPRKWYYGGGIRIKQIGFFNCDAPSNYYGDHLNDYINQGYLPVSEKKYDYNFFGTSNSSGYLVNTDFNIMTQDPFEFAYQKLYFGGYKNVTVTDSQNNGKVEYVFKDGLDPFDLEVDDVGVYFEDGKRGKLLSTKTYDNNAVLLNSSEFNYDFNASATEGGLSPTYSFSTLNNSYPYVFTPNPSTPNVTTNLLELGKLTQKKSIEYFTGGQSKTVVEYFSYDTTNFQLKEHQSTNSLGEVLRTEYTYDTNNSPFSQNRIYEPLQTKKYRGSDLIATDRINYGNSWPNNQSFQPYTIESSRSNNALEIKRKFNLYDEFGNLLEEQQENGRVTSYLWGYHKTYIVAKLENISYANIPEPIINYIQSKTDATTPIESEILTALSTLQINSDPNLKKAMVTTYTYKPLVGVSVITDAKGDKMKYEYDELGRLIRVRDKFDNILSETQYNLINQN